MRKFLTEPTVIDWLQWADHPEAINKPDMPQITLLLIKEYKDRIAELELDNARLEILVKIANELITNENARKDWENAKQTRVM